MEQNSGAKKKDTGWDGARRRLYEIVEVGRGEDRMSMIVDNFLIVLIILNITAFMMETVPSLAAQYGTEFYWFEVFSVVVFTIEYGVRIWTSVEVPFLKRLSPIEARLKFAMRPYLIIDLLAILPFYLSAIFGVDLRILRILRLFRFLKLARYSPALATLTRVIVNEGRTLMGALLLVIAMMLFASTGIYYLERAAQPDAFGSIPAAAWWAMTTLTTVGYGDVSPQTPLGKMFGSLIMVLGLGVAALPIAIISTGFAQEVSRRDFVVTWSLIARIPLLAELDANQVAEIMEYLKAHNFPQHKHIIEAGSPGDAMYFIASGEVILKANSGDVILHTGDFFGEIAMIDGTEYEFPYISRTRCKLLKLEKSDFIRMGNASPEIVNIIRKMAEKRKAARAKGEKDPRTLQG